MIPDRVFALVAVAAVLLIAAYAGGEHVAFGLSVAVIGLAACWRRVVLGIPAAAAVTVAGLLVPWGFVVGGIALLTGLGSFVWLQYVMRGDWEATSGGASGY